MSSGNKIRALTCLQLKSILIKLGWEVDRVRGSHHVMVKGTKTMPLKLKAGKELSSGYISKVLKQGGISIDEFLGVLYPRSKKAKDKVKET